MDDDLRKIPAFVRLSRRTSRILWQNITLALGIKAIFLALTIAGMGTMWMAVFATWGRACWWCSTGCGWRGGRWLRRAPALSPGPSPASGRGEHRGHSMA